MNLWTDGSVIVQTTSQPNEIRLYRDGELANTAVGYGYWRNILSVDIARGRILTKAPRSAAPGSLVELDLDTLEQTATFEDAEFLQAAYIGDGRIAAVIVGDEGPLFVVGQLGHAWELELSLDFQQRAEWMPTMTSEEPHERAFGGHVVISANEHGVVVADGQAGLAALWRDGDRDFAGCWYGGAANETELYAHATAEGMVYVSRWAARESLVRLIEPGGTARAVVSETSYSAEAGVTEEHVFVYDDHGRTVHRCDFKTGEVDAELQERFAGFIQASATGGGRFVLGFPTGVYVLRPQESGLVRETILAVQHYEVSFTTLKDGYEDLFSQLRQDPSIEFSGYSGQGTDNPEELRFAITKLSNEAAEKLSTKLSELGGTEITVAEQAM